MKITNDTAAIVTGGASGLAPPLPGCSPAGEPRSHCST